MNANIEDYCALDDSSFRLKMHELGYTVNIYVNTLVSYPNTTMFLVIARPSAFNYAGQEEIENFLVGNVGGRKLIACEHYSMYDWIEGDFGDRLEFITRPTTRKFPNSIQQLFKYADKSSHMMSVMLGKIFTRVQGYQDNRNKLVKAVMSGEDVLDIGLELKLRGLYIAESPEKKPKKRKK